MIKRILGVLLLLFLATRVWAAGDVRTVIYLYASQGNANALAKLRDEGFSVDSMDRFGNTPLCDAVRNGDKLAVHTLVSMGAKYNTPCMQSIPYERKYAMGFRKRYMPVQSKLSDSKSPIFDEIYAKASDGQADALRQMRQRGTNLDAMNCNMDTPYCQALIDENCTAYETLREVGVNVQHPCVQRLPSSKQTLDCDNKAIWWWIGGGAAIAAGTVAIVAASSGGGGGSSGGGIVPGNDTNKKCESNSDCSGCSACENNKCVDKTKSISVKEYEGNCCISKQQTYCPLNETAPVDSCSENKTDSQDTDNLCSITTKRIDLCTGDILDTNSTNKADGTNCGECAQCHSGTCESKIVQISSGNCCETKTNCCSLSQTCTDTCVKNPSCPVCASNSDCGECETCEGGSCVSQIKSVFVKEYNGNCCKTVEKTYCQINEDEPTGNCSENKTDEVKTEASCSTTTQTIDLCTNEAKGDPVVVNKESGTRCDTCGQCNATGTCVPKAVQKQTGQCCNEGSISCCPLDGEDCAACVPDESCSSGADLCLEGEFFSPITHGCEKCGLGTYSKKASLFCTPCAVGSYANQLGSTACTVCPVGWTTSATGATSCDVCESGYEKVGDLCLAECNAGYVRSGTACQACPVGTYALKGASECSACPEGSTTSAPGATYCNVCSDDYYMDNGRCVKAKDVLAKVICNPGYQPSKDGTECEVCLEGYFSVSGTQCEPCPTGSSTNHKGATSRDECTVCEDGYRLVNGVCQPWCSAGWYWNGTACQVCAPGSYSFYNGATQCSPCWLGTYQPYSGARTCFSCPSGKTTASEGSTSKSQCSLCESGYVLKDGVCVACPAGTYAELGDTVCTPCPIGKYTADSGFSSCNTCPTGKTTLQEGSDRCVCDTASGYVAIGENCVKKEYSCSAGQYWESASESCVPCEVGTYSGTGELFCTACPYGYYADKMGSTICQQCPIGWTTSTNKATSCDICASGYEKKDNSCVPACPAGSVLKGDACEPCPIGYFAAKGDDSCSACPKGYSTSAAGAYSCDVCDTNYVMSESENKCIHISENCSNGEQWKDGACQLCPIGTYKPYRSSICVPCAQGTYADTEGSYTCTHCANGSTTDVVGATSASQCNHCAVGYEWSPSANKCILQCHDGQFWNGTSCADCPAGSYSFGLAYKEFVPTYCEKCPAGRYNESTGQTTCTGVCPEHATSPQGAASIEECSCEYGFEKQGSGSSFTCQAKCEAGSYWTGITCAQCVAGTYSKAGATKCEVCAEGQYSAAGSSECTACPTGKSSYVGSAECDICALGYGGSDCTICSAGSYSNSSTFECELCPKGTYSTSDGTAFCTNCPKGYTTNGTGATSESACTECAEGYATQGSSCIPVNRICSAGEYWDKDHCATCRAGTFSLAGSPQCIDCPKGTYSSAAGAAACTACPTGYTTMGHAASSPEACSVCADGYQSNGTTCVPYKLTCSDGYYYNGHSCVAIPENGQKSDTDSRGWICQTGYTRVGNSCILTSTLTILTNPSGTTLTTPMVADSTHNTLINDGIIDLGNSSDTGMKGVDYLYGDSYLVNNGIIKNTSVDGDEVTGMSVNRGILDNNGAIELRGSAGADVYGIKASGYGQSNAFNYGQVLLYGDASSLYGIHGSSLYSYSDSSTFNYGDVVLKSYFGKEIIGLSNGDNYGSITIEDYQNDGAYSDEVRGISSGNNYGKINMDVQGALKTTGEAIGLYEGINYGQIEIYAKNNSISSNNNYYSYGIGIIGAENSTNMNQIHVVSDNNSRAIGVSEGSNYGKIKLETSDTTYVSGLAEGRYNYGDIEVIAVSSSNAVVGMTAEYNFQGTNYGTVNVTSVGYKTRVTEGLSDTDNYGKVYVSASGILGYGIQVGDNYGEVTLTGSASVLQGIEGLYNFGTITVDGSKTSVATGQVGAVNAGTINVANSGDENSVIGLTTSPSGTNTSEGIINITNSGAGTAFGLYGTSVKNEGQINITNTGSGKVYGIYGNKVMNSGTVNITNSGTGTAEGIHITASGQLTNTGTITINGSSYSGNAAHGNFIVLENGATIVNSGTINVPAWNLIQNPTTMADGGQLNVAGELVGQLNIGSDVVTSGFNTSYTATDMINAGNTDGLTLKSQSALFDAKLADNGSDVVMKLKSFGSVTDNATLAQFLANNYALKNNEAFYNKLKSYGDMNALTDNLNKLTGKDMLSRFNFEDMTMMRELNYDMNDKLFHNKERTFAVAGSVSPMAFKGDSGSSARYSLYNKRDGNTSVGLGVAFTDVRSDDDKDSNNRSETSYQLILPIGYKTHGFNLMTSPRIGYARGTYDRTGFDEKSYDGTIEKRVFGLMNEARYPITVGNWKFEPSAEFNILGYQQKGHEDAKEFALRIQNQTTYSVEGGIGLYATREEDFGDNGTLKLTSGVVAYHEFADPYKLRVGMEGMSGDFTLRDENRSSNRAVVRAGFNYDKDDLSLYGNLISYIDREWRTNAKTGVNVKF